MKAFQILLMSVILAVLTFSGVSGDSLLIIAPHEFIEELWPLQRFKNASARPTFLLELEGVYEAYTGVDEAEKVKKCIYDYAVNHGVDHVTLVGSTDKFPVRWRWWGRYLENDPYFRGNWSVSNGYYQQTNSTDEKYFGSWIEVPGGQTSYDIDVDLMAVGGGSSRRVVVFYADAERGNWSKFRVEIDPSKIMLYTCSVGPSVANSFPLNTNLHVTVKLRASTVEVFANGTQVINHTLTQTVYNRGYVGVGTYLCSARFDHFEVKNIAGVRLFYEDFNDGIANGFTDSTTAEERNWAFTDVYYGDLLKIVYVPPIFLPVFDSWDSNGNGLFGEIEWNADPDNCYPNCKVLNNDHISMVPEVRVGRIPASTEAEVSTYVKKVLTYEMGARLDADWFRRAALYEGEIGDGGVNNEISAHLSGKGFTVSNRRWSGDFGTLTAAQRTSEIAQDFNDGVGLMNYAGGHGNTTSWASINFTSNDVQTLLNNGGATYRQPVVLGAACLTGKMAWQPPFDAWVDVNGVAHPGRASCEAFDDPYAIRPACIQPNGGLECFAKALLLQGGNPDGSAGAIAYLGERTEGRFWGSSLARDYFTSYEPGATVGELWRSMLSRYHSDKNLGASDTWVYSEAKWEEGHMFDEPLKFILFGDSSVIIGGAFNNYLTGPVWNGFLGPLASAYRYRVTGDVVVPSAQTLNANPGASVFFEPGRKISVQSSTLMLSGSQSSPVSLMSLGPEPQLHAVQGAIIRGQMKVTNGGGVKFY
jgi:hypothetical protein